MKNVLSEVINYLLGDNHRIVTWGEPIIYEFEDKEEESTTLVTYITEVKKEIPTFSGLSDGLVGFLKIKFSEPVRRDVLSELIRKEDGESLVEDEEGVLTRDGYLGNSYHIQKKSKDNLSRLLSVSKDTIRVFIGESAGEDEMHIDARVLEILEEYPYKCEMIKKEKLRQKKSYSRFSK